MSIVIDKQPRRVDDTGDRRERGRNGDHVAEEASLTDRRALVVTCLIAGVAVVVHVFAALELRFPWIAPDELIYSELAKSIGAGSVPAVRGQPTLGYGLLYPSLIAPAWALLSDPAQAYAVAKVINSVVMGLAAFPAYFLARRFVSAGSAVLVAAFSVFVPSMLYSGALLIEVALYPVFLLALLGIVAAIQRPTRRNQLLAVGGILLACTAKPLAVVLVPAYVLSVIHLGVLDRRVGSSVAIRLRAHSTALGLLGLIALVAIGGSVLRGDPAATLGVYGVVLGNIDVVGTLVWFVRHLAGLDLYVGLVPFAAWAILVASSCLGRAGTRVNEFVAVSVWTIGGLLLAVAAYSSKPIAGAAGYIPSASRLHERNMFVVAPLLLVGLALFFERRRPASRWLLAGLVSFSVLLPVVLPLSRLRTNANFQALALIPWTAGGVDRWWPLTFVPFAVLAAVALRSSSTGPVFRAWAVVGFAFLATTVAAHGGMLNSSAADSSVAGVGSETRWIDRAVPPGADVLTLWVAPDMESDRPVAYSTVWMSEFFNRTVGTVVEVGEPMPYDLPHQVGTVVAGVLRSESGAPITGSYVLAPCTVAVRGDVVGSDPRVAARVYRVAPGNIHVMAVSGMGRSCSGLSTGTSG